MVRQNPPDATPTNSERALITAAWHQVQQIGSSAAKSIGADWARTAIDLSIPGYRYLRPIRRGGQGLIFQAVQESTGRKVAIKVLRAGSLAADAARFDREIRILGQLKHPNIVTIHDSGSAGGQFYFVMDYVDGRPLDVYVGSPDRPLDWRLRLFVRVCDAVHQAHLRGVIHRDLKPANILVDDAGEPHILDFGLAKLQVGWSDDASEATVTVPGQFMGSLPWASPEQAQGRVDELDVRSDVYSLGVVLHQVLTGVFPYPVRGGQHEVVANITSRAPARPSTLVRLDNDVDTIVLKCLAKEPERRYQSAGELARDIRHFLANEPIEAKRDSLSYVLRKVFRRHRISVVLGAAFGLIVAGSAIVSTAMYFRADEQRRLAVQAEQRAIERAEELTEARNNLEQVVSFQTSMLSDVDLLRMGRELVSGLREEVGRAATRGGMDAEGLLRAFDDAVAPVSAPGAALHLLDSEILTRASVAVEDQLTGQPHVQASLRHALGGIYRKLAIYDKAFEEMTAALEIRRRELGDDDPSTLKSILAMGGVLRDMGKLDESEDFHREALQGCQRVLGDDHADTLQVLNDLGLLMRLMGRLTEAEPYLRAALDGNRRVLGDDHAHTLNALTNLGMLLSSMARFEEAELHLREATEATQSVLGSDHPSTLAAMSNLGAMLWAQGRLAEAERYLKEILDKTRRVWGDDHPDTLRSIANLGVLLASMGRPEEAEPYYREAFEQFQNVLGKEHPKTLVAIGNLAFLLRRMGQLNESERYERQALEISRRVLGNDHPETLMSMNNMGFLLNQTNRLEEAEPLFREAVEGRRRVLGSDHPDTAASMSGLATVLLGLERFTEAEVPARECLAIRARIMPDHWLLYHAMGLLGAALAGQGRFTEAGPLVMEAYEKMDAPVDRIAFKREALERVVELLEAWHESDPISEYDAMAAEWRAKLERFEDDAQTQPQDLLEAPPTGEADRQP